MPKMRDNEMETDVSLVGRLLTTQFPQWAQLPLIPVVSAGTDNVPYRLGDDIVVRPRIDWAVDNVHKEHYWLPRLVLLLPLAILVPLAKGSPGAGYPRHWSVYEWFSGENATMDGIADPYQGAIDLARFITALQQIDTTKASLAIIDSNPRSRPVPARDLHPLLLAHQPYRCPITPAPAPESPTFRLNGSVMPLLCKRGEWNVRILERLFAGGVIYLFCRNRLPRVNNHENFHHLPVTYPTVFHLIFPNRKSPTNL